ncbi:hypothetical protein [Litorihabitans aurantiacus]|uniref:Uncharacterized protein n=1 Tax=Litorihabitans aurantiacus TaxID=1930061 RepID=A0AA37XGA4_9MICO|nr:hypothetical protein [Litorihabitans aurantiacus]GMA33043.1 hypothetical protein GCM10025875_30350 [Litorihabitans aurantiacus]
MRSIADDLLAAADGDVEPATAKALAKAAKTLTGYSRAPGKTAEAVRVARVLTPAVVDVIGASLTEVFLADAADPSLRLGAVVEVRYGVCAVLVAAGAEDVELGASGRRAAEALVPLVDGLTPGEAEAVLHLTTLVPDSPVAAPLAAVATARLEREPATPARRWVEGLGITGLPLARWEVAVEVPGELRLVLSVSDLPGSRSFFTVYVTGTSRYTTILGDDHTRSGQVVAFDHRSDPEIAGRIGAPAAIEDFPRVVTDMLAASPAVALDPAAAKVRPYPRTLLSAADRKRIIAWVRGATA